MLHGPAQRRLAKGAVGSICSGIGAIIYCHAAVQGEPMPAAEQIRVVAYNMHNYLLNPSAEPRSSAAKSEREIYHLVKILTELKPDILGMEEMGTEGDLIDLQTRLQAAGLPLTEREWVAGPDPVRHVAVLSRFPITARDSHKHLTYQMGNDTLPMQRGMLDVTVEVNPAYHLRLIGLHLKSQREVEEADQAMMRRQEAHLARLQVEKILSTAPETNLLLFGDLNETKEQPGVKEIKGPIGQPTSLRELPVEDANGAHWTYYYEPADTYSRIDYLMASPALVPELRLKQSGIYGGKDWSEASDHRPVFLTLVPVEQAQK